MKLIIDTTRKLSASFMHYVCIRSKFRSAALKDSLPQQKAGLCHNELLPIKGLRN